MGLDNGICVKKNAVTQLININNTFIDDDDYDYNSNEIDIAYWRKCWGLRNDIMEYLSKKYNVNDSYTFNLEVEDIKQIIEILISWYDKKKWNSESQSIWTWKEIKGNLLDSIRNLSYLLGKMEDYPHGFIVYFYDSY